MAGQHGRRVTGKKGLAMYLCIQRRMVWTRNVSGRRDREDLRLTRAYAFPNHNAFAMCIPYSALAMDLEVEIGLPYSGKVADGGGHGFENFELGDERELGGLYRYAHRQLVDNLRPGYRTVSAALFALPRLCRINHTPRRAWSRQIPSRATLGLPYPPLPLIDRAVSTRITPQSVHQHVLSALGCVREHVVAHSPSRIRLKK